MGVLEIRDVSLFFGGLPALKDFSLNVNEGEIVGLIGPNGAGKTTVINFITGVYNPARGDIFLGEKRITGIRPYKICRLGIARTFQIPRPFGRITTGQNIMVSQRSFNKNPDEYLSLVGLERKRDLPAGKLTFSERRKLEIARALAAEPKIILLDEIMAGLNASETEEMIKIIKMIQKDLKMTILWIEHVMQAIMETAERIIVLNQGSKLMEGLPGEVASDERVIEVYLGEKYLFKGEQLA
ncbi:MAG: ABC transporter ATP-binding protein [Desulfocucumaceae bacterium]